MLVDKRPLFFNTLTTEEVTLLNFYCPEEDTQYFYYFNNTGGDIENHNFSWDDAHTGIFKSLCYLEDLEESFTFERYSELLSKYFKTPEEAAKEMQEELALSTGSPRILVGEDVCEDFVTFNRVTEEKLKDFFYSYPFNLKQEFDSRISSALDIALDPSYHGIPIPVWNFNNLLKAHPKVNRKDTVEYTEWLNELYNKINYI